MKQHLGLYDYQCDTFTGMLRYVHFLGVPGVWRTKINKREEIIFPFIYMARSTFPERRQRVHTYARLGAPFTTMRTLLKLGSQRLLLRLCE